MNRYFRTFALLEPRSIATYHSMKIVEKNRNRLVIEHSPLKNIAFFSALNMAFLVGIVMSLGDGTYLHTLLLLLCFGLCTYLAYHVIARVRLTLDLTSGAATLCQWGFHAPKSQSFPLSDLNQIEVEEEDGAYRLSVALKSQDQSVPLTAQYVGGAKTRKAAEVANHWLNSSR